VQAGQPKLEASQNLPDFPYAQYAESIGLHGIKIERPDQIVPAWREALASRRPVVIEAVVDPEVPPLPPHITVQQAAGLAQAVLKHDPNWRHMVRQIYREVVEGWVRK
jgi:pyruvate dehydrogenase (quinone)